MRLSHFIKLLLKEAAYFTMVHYVVRPNNFLQLDKIIILLPICLVNFLILDSTDIWLLS